MQNAEILLETLTHIFYVDGSKVSKLAPVIKKQEVKRVKAIIGINPTSFTHQDVCRLIAKLGVQDGVVVEF